jgi:hypothetical protein
VVTKVINVDIKEISDKLAGIDVKLIFKQYDNAEYKEIQGIIVSVNDKNITYRTSQGLSIGNNVDKYSVSNGLYQIIVETSNEEKGVVKGDKLFENSKVHDFYHVPGILEMKQEDDPIEAALKRVGLHAEMTTKYFVQHKSLSEGEIFYLDKIKNLEAPESK